jgi:hypothetical protein
VLTSAVWVLASTSVADIQVSVTELSDTDGVAVLVAVTVHVDAAALVRPVTVATPALSVLTVWDARLPPEVHEKSN